MPGPNLHSSSYSPAGNTLSGLKAHVKLWEERLKVNIDAIESLDEISNSSIRAQLANHWNVKGWYDSSTGRVAVYLPNILSSSSYPESLLDKTLLHEIIGHRGLMNLLGRERFDRYCDNLWEHMSEPLRNRFLRYVSGNERLVSDRRAAAAEFVAHAAEELAEGNTGRWAFAMGELSRVFPRLKQVADMSESKLYDSIGKAVRFYNKIRHYNTPNLSPEELDAGLDRKWDSLEGMLRGYVYRDYDDVIKMGRPCQQLLYSSVRARNLPIELRTNALLGSEYDDKQDRHPFSSSDLHGFAKNLANPLAVFYSNNREKPYTTLELIANHTGEGKNRRNFIVPLTPITNKEGYEVMNIDSVYQKEDMTIMYWLSKTYVDRNGNERPSLLRYIGNGFFNEWFTPARERIIKAYEEKIQALEESLERTKPAIKRQSDSAEVSSRLTDLKRDFNEVKDIIARAANVVINFENPKIPEENIRLFYRKDSALSEEVRALKERTIADGSFMKAPDGSPSRLSEDEWLLAHSSAFRRYYGDWEGHLLDEEIRKNGVNSVSLQLLKNLLSYYEETGEDILERIPPEALRSNAERDGKAVAASLLVRADGSSDSSHSLGEQHADLERQGVRQESTLESWAKGLGVWFDDTDRAFINNNLPDGGFIGEGKEAKVWHGDGGSVTKVISLRNYVSPQHALDRILLHNHHFPEAPLDVIGFGRDSSGAFQIVTRQPFVQGEKMSFSQINSFVRSLGFGPAGRHHEPVDRQNVILTTAHTTDEYFLGDLHVANVLLTDSGPAVIDSEMRINTPGLGYGGKYIIPERKHRFDLTEKREPKAFDVQRVALALGLSDDFEHIYFSKTEQIQENGIKMDKPLSFYEGRITPEQNTVFVFGSNPEGRHGAGAARVAAEQFGAVYGKGEGLQGSSYALPTKDLAEARRRGVYSPADSHWKEMTDMVLWYYREDGGGHPYASLFTSNPYPRSIAPDTIVSSIIELYRTADAQPDKDFKVAYTTAPEDFSLNGYCGGEMAEMFKEAGRRYGHLPHNVLFSSAWRSLFEGFGIENSNENKNHNIMPTERITFTTSSASGYRQRTIENAEAADLTIAFATDFSTAGERLTRNAAGRKYVAVPLAIGMTAQDLAEYIESAINLHYEAEGKERNEIPSFTLNIAGNGMQTLAKSGFSQESVNALFSEAFRIVLTHGYSFSSVRSGGQTGIDEAGVRAAADNGIPAIVHTTADWRWRGADGVDRYGEDGFKARFVNREREFEELANDLAIEMSVGGDRFSPSDIAPRMRALIPEGKEDAFRDAVRTRYKEIMPAAELDEEGLAFLEREINIWCSDEQFKLGAAMLNIERDPDDYNNELDAADSFRLVSDGIIAAVFPNAIFPSPSQAKSFEIVLYSKDGARLPAQGFIRSVDNGTGEQIPDFKIEGDVLTANVTVYDGKAGSDPQTEHFHQEVMKVNTETGEMISIERENQKTNDMPNKIENPVAAGKNRLRAGLYTLGLGNRSWAEFKSMLPAATTVVVDMRHYTTNPSAPHFNLSSIRKGLTDSGITYEWRPELSGVPSAAGEHLGDGKARKSVRPSVEAVTSPDSRDVVDYDRYAATPEFRLGYEAVKNYINEGKCVVVISGESDPVRSARVKLLGQALLRDGYDAVHLDSERASRGVQGAIRQRRQEETVAAAMHGSTLLEGDYRQIGFLSNGSFKAAPGAVVRRKDVSSAAEKRMINDVALDNYQKPVSFTEDRESNPFNVSKHNAQDADFSIVFTARRPGYTLRAVTDAVGRGDRARVYIPEHREDLFDEANIAHQAERIADRIAWHLAAHPERAAEGLLINVAGSDLPHINIREVEGQVSAKEIDNPGGEEEQERGRAQRVPAGYKLDDVAGITQEDMNEFVYRVLSKVNGHGIGGPKGEEGGFRIKVDGILTDGNTGVAEAGTIAAQRMGIDPRVNAPKGWGLTYDDESLKGRRVNDEAMFKNRFRQGLAERTVLSEEEIRVRAEQQEFARREENDGFKTGLTDMQVLTLHFLGYPNHHIVDMVDIADRNDVVIDSPESFLEFLEQCEGYGIMGADRLDATKIRDTAAYSANLVKRSLEKGITLTTIVSPDYPSGLRNMADYDVAEAVPAYVVKNGVLSASMEGSKYRETRPAILWRQGDASLTERASVAMIGGGRWSDGAAGRIAAQLGKGLAEQDVALVANRFEGPQREGIEAALAAGGKVVYLTEDPIQKEEPAERDAESIRLGKVGDAPVDRNADLHKKIVENGGVVFSEKSIDEKPGEKKKRRAERVATSLGAAAAVIDDVNKLNPEALGEVATYTTAGLFFGVSSLVKHLFGKQPDAELDENGAGIDELADAAKGVSQQERLEEGLVATNPAIMANEIGDLYPEYHTVPMIVSPEGQRVLFISQRYPDVIKALKEKYGEDIRFADPKNYNTVLQRMKTRTVDYDGGSISLLDDESLSGTRPQVEAPRETRVHFVKGDIYGTATAPDGVPGLASAGMRASDYALFQRFREEALRIEGGLLAAVGMEGRHALKFANACYPVIGKDKVEVWHGDDLAAVVGLGPDGTLRVTDPTGDFFGMEKPYLSQKNFEKMTARMEEWILKEGPVRSEDYSLATREEREELDKPYDGPDEYDNVSETLRESNIDVAIRDVNAAIEKKTLLEGNGKPFEKERAVALLLKERAELEKRIADSAEKIAAQRSRVDTLQLQYDNALNSAASGDQLFVAEEELKTAKSGLGDLLAERERMEASRGMNILHTGAIAFAGKVTREDAGSSKTVSLCVDGNRVDIAAAKLTEEEKAAGKAELEALAQGRRSAEEQVLSSMTFLNSETREVEVKLVKPEEQSLAEAKKKAELSEVVGNLVNGYYTVSRDGKMAYADSKLNIVSDWYDKVEPFGLSCGFAYRDGKLNILKGEGLVPVLPVWLDGIGAPVDGISLVRSGDLYNYLDLETGEFLLLKWKQEAFDFKNGWGVFKQGPEDYVDGKYNYINRNGEMLNDQGYDRCDDFEDGLATVISNGEAHRVDTEGNDLGTIKLEIDDKAAEERVQDGRGLTLRGPFGSGSGSGK